MSFWHWQNRLYWAGTFNLCRSPQLELLFNDSETSPVQIVMTGDAKDAGRYSTNDWLLKGPNVIPLIPTILTHIHAKNQSMVADILKAFVQIQLSGRPKAPRVPLASQTTGWFIPTQILSVWKNALGNKLFSLCSDLSNSGKYDCGHLRVNTDWKEEVKIYPLAYDVLFTSWKKNHFIFIWFSIYSFVSHFHTRSSREANADNRSVQLRSL
jgi:hypothetical protein